MGWKVARRPADRVERALREKSINWLVFAQSSERVLA